MLALPVGQLRVELPGLRVDEVGGEGVGVAPEQRIGQGHVAPEEPGEVEADEEHGERVDEPPGDRDGEVLAEQRPVRQGVAQVRGEQRAGQPFAVGGAAAGDVAERGDGRHVELAEHVEQVVLVLGDRVLGLLDRDDDPGELDEAHDVPGDAARQPDEQLARPVGERDAPRQRGDRAAEPVGGDVHGSIISRRTPRGEGRAPE